jgi:hypothetical protein
VTIHPGSAVINSLAVSRIELNGEGGEGVVDMDEDPKVTQPTQPVTEALKLIAEPRGFVPELAVQVAFEDGSYLEPPTTCQLRAKLLDASGAVLLDAGGAASEVKRVGGQVELCAPGEEARRAFLLRQDLLAPERPGEYSLELSLSFGSTKGLPSKDVLESAGRAEVTKVVTLVVVAGPASQLKPMMLLPASSPAIEVISTREAELGVLAHLVDACGNVVQHAVNEPVKLSLRPYTTGSQDTSQMTLTLAQPTPTLHLVNGVLAAPKLQLAGEGPSGRYELRFELVANSDVFGTLHVEYQNPADEGRREEHARRKQEQLQELKGRLQEAVREEEELGMRKKACTDAVRKGAREHDRAVKAQQQIQQQMQQQLQLKRSRGDALGLDDEGVKRLKTSLVESDSATSQLRPPSFAEVAELGPKLRKLLKVLEKSLTVRINLSDGEGAEHKRKRDFPIELPSEENHRVQYELRPLSSGNDDGSRGLYVFKVSSRGGVEASAERMGDQCLRDDPAAEYLLDALQPNGRPFESLFESGRVADTRLSDIAVALVAPWSGADYITLRPPAAAAATAPTPASLLAELARLVPGMTHQLLQPASAAEASHFSAKVDATTGLMKLGPDGAIHPPPAARGASFLLNRLCCDDPEARVTWARALGPYVQAIVFDQASAMCDYIAHAATSSVLIALNDDAGLLSGGGRYAMFSHGKHSALAVPADSPCRLAQTTEADEEQVLRGTAEGSKVVEFEQAAKELVGLEGREQAAADEVASAEGEKTKAEEAQQQVEQELIQRQQQIEQLRQQTGTPAGSRGKKRTR